MIKLIEQKNRHIKGRAYILEMHPLEVARVVAPGEYNGHIVIRTANTNQIEIMNLTNPGADMCWTWSERKTTGGLEVELLPPGTIISFEVV